jgi:hypothetical protein
MVQKLCLVIYQNHVRMTGDIRSIHSPSHALTETLWSRHNVASMWLGYSLEEWGFVIWFPAGIRDFSLLQSIQTISGAHPASYWIDAGTLSPGVKQQQRETAHSPPSTAKAKNVWGYKYIWPTCLHSVHRDNFTLCSTWLLTVFGYMQTWSSNHCFWKYFPLRSWCLKIQVVSTRTALLNYILFLFSVYNSLCIPNCMLHSHSRTQTVNFKF